MHAPRYGSARTSAELEDPALRAAHCVYLLPTRQPEVAALTILESNWNDGKTLGRLLSRYLIRLL